MENRKGRLFLVMLFASAMSLVATGAFAAIDQAAVDSCKTCHEDVVNKFMAGAHHGKVWGKTDGKQYSCESCHGPGEKHMEDNSLESIISFGKKSKQSIAEQDKACLSCHEKAPGLAHWNMGKHKKGDVSCSSCHTAHTPAGKVVSNDSCFSCHQNVKSQVNRFSHHPIIEGKVSCNDCHNPHGTMAKGMIKAESNNQLCYTCHADKRGPFMFEHPPVEENCMTCHTPHGSQHEHLLVRKQPNLCQDCHNWTNHPSAIYAGGNGFAPGTISKQLIARSCTNCHDRVHGSTAPISSGGTKQGPRRFVR